MAKPALIVDDDGAIRGLLRAVLTRRGIECDFAADGVEALEKLTQNEYCALVLDLMMPNVNGYHVLAKLREIGHEIPIIVITAAVLGGLNDLDMTQVMQVLRKPFDLDQLDDAISRTLCGVKDELPAAS